MVCAGSSLITWCVPWCVPSSLTLPGGALTSAKGALSSLWSSITTVPPATSDGRGDAADTAAAVADDDLEPTVSAACDEATRQRQDVVTEQDNTATKATVAAPDGKLLAPAAGKVAPVLDAASRTSTALVTVSAHAICEAATNEDLTSISLQGH